MDGEESSQVRCGLPLLERAAAKRKLEAALSGEASWRDALSLSFVTGSVAAADAAAMTVVDSLKTIPSGVIRDIRADLVLLLAAIPPSAADAVSNIIAALLSHPEKDKVFASRVANGPREINISLIARSFESLVHHRDAPKANTFLEAFGPWLAELIASPSVPSVLRKEYRSLVCSSVALLEPSSMRTSVANLLLNHLAGRGHMLDGFESDSSFAGDMSHLVVDATTGTLLLKFALVAGLQGDCNFLLSSLRFLEHRPGGILSNVVRTRIGTSTYCSILALVIVRYFPEKLAESLSIIRFMRKSLHFGIKMDDGVRNLILVAVNAVAVWVEDHSLLDDLIQSLQDDKENNGLEDVDKSSPIEILDTARSQHAAAAALAIAMQFEMRALWTPTEHSQQDIISFLENISLSCIQSDTPAAIQDQVSYSSVIIVAFLGHPKKSVRKEAALSVTRIPDARCCLVLLQHILNCLVKERSSTTALCIIQDTLPKLALDTTSSLPVMLTLRQFIEHGGPISDVALISAARVASACPAVAYPQLASLAGGKSKEWETISPDERISIAASIVVAIQGRPARGAVFVPLIQQCINTHEMSPFAASLGLEALYELCEEGVLDPTKTMKIVSKSLELSLNALEILNASLRRSYIRLLGVTGRVDASNKGRSMARKCVALLREIVRSKSPFCRDELLIGAQALLLYRASLVLEFEEMDEDRLEEITQINQHEAHCFTDALMWQVRRYDFGPSTSIFRLLCAMLSHDWSVRSRMAFAEDRLQKLRMASAALQRSRKREAQSGHDQVDVVDEFLEYVTFLPEGVIRAATEKAALVASRAVSDRKVGALACESLCRSDCLPSGLPWCSLVDQFWRHLVDSTEASDRSTDEYSAQVVIQLAFSLPRDITGPQVFALTSRAGGLLHVIPQAALHVLVRGIICREDKNIVGTVFSHCKDKNAVAQVIANLLVTPSSAELTETSHQIQKEWDTLCVDYYLGSDEEVASTLVGPLSQTFLLRRIEDFLALVARLHRSQCGQDSAKSIQLLCRIFGHDKSELKKHLYRSMAPLLAGQPLLNYLATHHETPTATRTLHAFAKLASSHVDASERDLLILELIQHAQQTPTLSTITTKLAAISLGLSWAVHSPRVSTDILGPIIASRTSNPKIRAAFLT